MIRVTDIGGNTIYVNNDKIERLETVPETVIVLEHGHRFMVRETAQELIERIESHKRRCLRGRSRLRLRSSSHLSRSH